MEIPQAVVVVATPVSAANSNGSAVASGASEPPRGPRVSIASTTPAATPPTSSGPGRVRQSNVVIAHSLWGPSGPVPATARAGPAGTPSLPGPEALHRLGVIADELAPAV